MLDRFVTKNEKLTFELGMPVLVKVSDPFLRIQKNRGPKLSLDMGKSALVINEEEAPALAQKKTLPQRGKGKGVERQA